MGTSKMRVMGLAAVMAVALFGFAELGLAGGPQDPAVKTVVETFFCTSTDSTCTAGTLTVEVSLSKEADPSAEPAVAETVAVAGSNVVPALKVYLEQHWPRSVNSNGWLPIDSTVMAPTVTQPCCPFGTSSSIGTTVSVTTDQPIEYTDLCTPNTAGVLAVDPTANAIRAVAVVNVTNAKNKTGFLGRSVSIPNPCKG